MNIFGEPSARLRAVLTALKVTDRDINDAINEALRYVAVAEPA